MYLCTYADILSEVEIPWNHQLPFFLLVFQTIRVSIYPVSLQIFRIYRNEYTYCTYKHYTFSSIYSSVDNLKPLHRSTGPNALYILTFNATTTYAQRQISSLQNSRIATDLLNLRLIIIHVFLEFSVYERNNLFTLVIFPPLYADLFLRLQSR